jgi:hypothetical protein
MKYYTLVAFVCFSACSAPAPKTHAESYQKMINENKGKGYQFAMAGPDYRYPSGEIANLVSNKYAYPTTGVYGVGRATLEEATEAAIAGCEERIGENDCYLYYKNTTFVRVAQRKKWLKRNSEARKAIKVEKQEWLEKQRINALRSSVATPTTSVAATPTTSGQPDYDKAEALFDIANKALQSTLPQQRNTIKCNTILNPLGGTTTCR